MKHLFVWVLIKCCAYNSLPINGVLSERFLFCTDQIFKQTMFCELSITALVPFISIKWETMYIKALFIRGYWICFDCSKNTYLHVMQIGGGGQWFCDESTKSIGHGTDGSVTDGEVGFKK